ncbi:hypothetical protein BJ684DRAFT_17047 [Piptocephalis cylindrospora]|uniref:Uncharacterized protein n=1 Tax=Piptocephalis cylindrospora TaxID=1907219 RepID=A0A4P9Y0X1_9FUNG|nr:hypothetical protein BJ684DRAFT_17047 [Piptocephalis cylindrospora]|eukprot:RKP12466.1 hypothetical protein BJ684DRAFT_17047 [Piptocephalis cylindrospora]
MAFSEKKLVLALSSLTLITMLISAFLSWLTWSLTPFSAVINVALMDTSWELKASLTVWIGDWGKGKQVREKDKKKGKNQGCSDWGPHCRGLLGDEAVGGEGRRRKSGGREWEKEGCVIKSRDREEGGGWRGGQGNEEAEEGMKKRRKSESGSGKRDRTGGWDDRRGEGKAAAILLPAL